MHQSQNPVIACNLFPLFHCYESITFDSNEIICIKINDLREKRNTALNTLQKSSSDNLMQKSSSDNLEILWDSRERTEIWISYNKSHFKRTEEEVSDKNASNKKQKSIITDSHLNSHSF